MKKSTEKASLFSQIKALPNKVKMFVLGLVVIAAALAFVLPNMDLRLLQGSILNVRMYGYGYEKEPNVFVDGYGYGYGYDVDEKTNKYVRINRINSIFDDETNELRIEIEYSRRFNGIFVVEPTLWVDEHSVNAQQENHGMGGGESGKCRILQKDTDVCKMYRTFWINNYAHKGANVKITPIFETKVTIVNNDLRNLGVITVSPKEVSCQTPENVLACSLKLATCPQQCRLPVCQTPENALACSLNLDSCPTECRYDGTNTETGAVYHPDLIISKLALDSSYPNPVVNDEYIHIQTSFKNIGVKDFSINDIAKIKCAGHEEDFSNETHLIINQPIALNGLKVGETMNLGLRNTPTDQIYLFPPQNGNQYHLICKVSLSSSVLSESNIDNNSANIYFDVLEGSSSTSYRTDWLDRDDPSGNGDYETYSDFMPIPCKDGYQSTDIKFVRIDESVTTQTVHWSPKGGYCLNKENPEGCTDYKVKFFCEKIGSKTLTVETPKEITIPLVEKPTIVKEPTVVETPKTIEKPRTVETPITIETSKATKTPTTEKKVPVETTTTARSTIIDIFKDLLK